MTEQMPATAAGRKLLAYLDNEWSDKWDIDADAILAIEAEAVAPLEAEITRLRTAIQAVLDDAESQHPGGWGPDVTTVEFLRAALAGRSE